MTSAHEGDEGQITLPLIAFVLVMAALALGMFGFGEASDSRGKAQKAADAAALAGAVAARDVIPSTIANYAAMKVDSAGLEGLRAAGGAAVRGAAACRAWAAQNDAEATECSYLTGGQFRARTSSEPSPERELVGGAEASADIHQPTCDLFERTDTWGNLHSWLTCSGNGGSAQAYYLNTALQSTSTPVQWKSVYRVRLTD